LERRQDNNYIVYDSDSGYFMEDYIVKTAILGITLGIISILFFPQDVIVIFIERFLLVGGLILATNELAKYYNILTTNK